ncbi:hypothetical protein [Flammeovirga aprica]|uniref:SseB protein N-terminal domain-containing protein n=1 Tax=Flammeovirga aprica JL-4 TaxID=694437 RepID=A0A7X9RZ25_9BACT|nr:hypothetical protein [Flammeovirga aprica]NME71432.1 hypothetical protein [Flammeovirga aprica JL-4]
MGFFDFLKGKKREEKQSTESTSDNTKNKFLTNIEDFGFEKFELGITGKVRVDGILAIAEFLDRAKKQGIECSHSVMYVSLLEEGALTVPIVINYGDQAYTLFFIYNEEDLLKYKSLEQHVGKTAYPNLIYFSAIPIYDGYEPKEIIEPFQLADMRVEKEAEVKGTYAMWWSNDGEEKFGESETLKTLTKLYDVFKGYETYLFGYILRQTRITESTELQRLSLPEESANFVLVAPENKLIMLNISQEKGIRFLFPTNETTKEYRERFLSGVLVDFLSTRLYLQQHQANEDEEMEPNSYDWFNFMAKVTTEREKEGEGVDLVGAMMLD